MLNKLVIQIHNRRLGQTHSRHKIGGQIEKKGRLPDEKFHNFRKVDKEKSVFLRSDNDAD